MTNTASTVPNTIQRALLVTPMNRANYFDLETVLSRNQSMEPPLGLSYIASYAKKFCPDLEVEVFDLNLQAIKHIREVKRVDLDELWGLLAAKVEEFKPDIVGVGCLFHVLFSNAHKVCQVVKAATKPPITVMGGNYPTGLPNFALSDENLDFVLFSEGERSFTELILCLREGSDPSKTVDGIAFRPETLGRLGLTTDSDDPDEQLRLVRRKVFTPTLDQFPWPDRTDWDMEFYATNVRHFVNRVEDGATMRLATMTASRGCPFSCSFCASKDFWGNQIRYRDPKDVVAEMRWLADTHGINTFVFNDDNLLFKSESVIALCDEIVRQNLKIRWFAGGGLQVSALRRKDVVDAVVGSGLRQFNLAIESGDKETLRRIKKPLKDAEMAEEVIANIRRHDGVWIEGFFINGFWFQTLDDMTKSCEYAGTLDMDWGGFYNFTPLPGTDDYKVCVERGYIPDFMSMSGAYSEDMIRLSTENFTADQVLTLNYRANLKWNFLHNRNIERNPTQALRDFDYILDLYKDHAFCHHSRGRTLARMGRFEEAESALNRARDIALASRNLERDRFTANIQILDTDLRWIDYFRELGIDPENPAFVTDPIAEAKHS